MSQNVAEATNLDASAAAVALRESTESGFDIRPPAALEKALQEARTRIPPLWPLESFVAVNPFLGQIDPIWLNIDEPHSFQIEATDIEGDEIFYKVDLLTEAEFDFVGRRGRRKAVP